MSDSERPSTAKKDGDNLESTTNGTHQIPTPPQSTEELHNYSDAPSVDSQHSHPQQRRHQRGGRKPKQRDGRQAQSCSGCGIHCGQGREDDVEEESEPEEEQNEADDYDQQSLRNARSRKSAGARPKVAPKSDTGFKVFNMERAEASGGRRPFGVTVERPESKKNTQSKGKKEQRNEQQNQEDGAEEEQKEERKPVSIRLDLNLELEIFLRAKIKGDITITFLE